MPVPGRNAHKLRVWTTTTPYRDPLQRHGSNGAMVPCNGRWKAGSAPPARAPARAKWLSVRVGLVVTWLVSVGAGPWDDGLVCCGFCARKPSAMFPWAE